MSERWLVTGAGGFLGRYVLEALEAGGHEPTTLDRRTPARPGGLLADLADGPPDLGTSPPDVVAHLASLVHHRASGRAFERSILDGTRNLLAALDRFDAPPRAFLYASTVAVYGLERGELVPETAPAAADTPYGRSKRLAEELVLDWAERRRVSATILRLPALVGHGMAGSLATLVAALERRAYLGIGAGGARRSLVLAGDVANALPRLAATAGVFHLTDRVHPTFRSIESAVRTHLGRRPPRRIPLGVARLIARTCDLVAATGIPTPFSSEILDKATSTLTFDDTRAVERIGWSPRPVLDHVAEWVAPASAPMPPSVQGATGDP